MSELEERYTVRKHYDAVKQPVEFIGTKSECYVYINSHSDNPISPTGGHYMRMRDEGDKTIVDAGSNVYEIERDSKS